MTQKALLQSAGDGTAVPQGYVGETLTSNVSSISLGSSASYKTLTSLTLNKGVYLVFAKLAWSLTSTGLTGLSALAGGISLSNNALDGDGRQRVLIPTSNVTNTDIAVSPRYLVISSDSTLVYLVSRIDYSSAGSATAEGLITSVRIA